MIQIEDGVELIEKGKSLRGNDIKINGKLKLLEYQKMKDPRVQQISSTLEKRKQETSMERLDNEDPYKSFRRSLLEDKRHDESSARGLATSTSRNRAKDTQQSGQS